MDMKSRRIHTVTFLYHCNISQCLCKHRPPCCCAPEQLSSGNPNKPLNESSEMVIQTSEHFSNIHFAIFCDSAKFAQFSLRKMFSPKLDKAGFELNFEV